MNGPLKSEIITDMEDYSDTMSDTELEASVTLLSNVEDHSPPASPLGGGLGRERNHRPWRKVIYVKAFGPC